MPCCLRPGMGEGWICWCCLPHCLGGLEGDWQGCLSAFLASQAVPLFSTAQGLICQYQYGLLAGLSWLSQLLKVKTPPEVCSTLYCSTSYFSPGLNFSLDLQDTGVLTQQLCLPWYDTAPSQAAFLSQQQHLLVRYQHKVQKMLQMKIPQTLRIILPAVKAPAGSSEVQYNSNYFFSKRWTPALHFLLRLSQHLIVYGFKLPALLQVKYQFPHFAYRETDTEIGKVMFS